MGQRAYHNITETLTDLHGLVIDRLAPAEGVRWLDLACGTGAMAELATKRGADVTGIDLAPALIETAKERAQEQGLDIDYRVGDCENLDVPDASFDVVSSTSCGVMFAPDHEATARELARIVKSGGRIGLANWTPEGGLAKMFGMMKPSSRLRPKALESRSSGAAKGMLKSSSVTPSSSTSSGTSRTCEFRAGRTTGGSSR